MPTGTSTPPPEDVTSATASSSLPRANRNRLRPMAALALATVLATALGRVLPLAGPMLLGLGLGVLISNVPRLEQAAGPAWIALDRTLLRTGVALLGLKVAVGDVLGLGWQAVVVAAATVAFGFAITRRIGVALGVGEQQRTLIAAGFSICGAAAVAGVQDTVKAKPREVGLAVALVTVFGSAMIVLVPTAARLLGLSDDQAAVWAGASIHEVSQVVAAGALLGGGTVLAMATTVKLCRVVLLAPVQVFVGAGSSTHRTGPLVPWFVLAFLAAVALRSTGWLSDTTVSGAGLVTTVLLTAAMIGLGRGVRGRELWPVPVREFALAACATAAVATFSLVLTLALIR